MKIERTKNATRNIVIGFINKIVVLLLPFFVRTAFIYSLGAEYLGLNSLFTSILTVLNMAELGFSSAVVFSMYKPIANDDEDTICAILNYLRKIYRVVGTVILIGGLILMPFLPKLIRGKCPDELNIYILFLIYLLNTALTYLLFAYKKSIIEAFQRNDYISLNDTITTGLTNVLQLVLLLSWKSIYAYYIYLLIMLLFTVINNLLNARVVNKKFSQYKCKGRISDSDRKIIKKQVGGLVIGRICQMTQNSFDSIFISAFIGLTMTTIYNNYYFVVNGLVGIMNVITVSMLAGIGNSIAAESKEKNYKDFTKFNFIYIWISSWIAVTVFCLYNNFMILWVGKKLTLSLLAAVLFSSYFFVMKMCDIRITYVSAAGLWWENRIRALIEMLTNIVLNFVLVQLFGIYGVISATIISMLFVNFIFGAKILFKHYFTDYSVMKYYFDNAIYVAVVIASAFITWTITSRLGGNGLINLVLRGIVCCIVPNLILLLVYFKTDKFKASKEWVFSKFKRKNS